MRFKCRKQRNHVKRVRKQIHIIFGTSDLLLPPDFKFREEIRIFQHFRCVFSHAHSAHFKCSASERRLQSIAKFFCLFVWNLFYPSVPWRKILNRSWLDVYCPIEYFTENTLSELWRSVIARNPLFTPVYIFYVICDLNWSLKFAKDYAKQVEHKISQTPVGWEHRDAFGAYRRIWEGICRFSPLFRQSA
jgi:hypothetical protein